MASMALHHHVATMPVVDEAGRLVGVVGPTTLMGIMHRLADITRESDRGRQAIEEPPLRRARHRLPWLVVGLGLERLTGGELRTGILIGTVLALLAFPMVWLVFGELLLAAAVTLALAAASIVASTLSLLIYFTCVSLIVL